MLFVVLPAYNEAEALPTLLDDIEQTCHGMKHKVVVVNDGSTDLTAKVLERYSAAYKTIETVTHWPNKGLGEALLSGFKFVINYRLENPQDKSDEEEIDLVVTMDSDNTHPPDRIPLLVNGIRDGADLAIASRFIPGGEQIGLALLRRVLSWGAGKVMHVFFPIDGVKDYSCGYRAYRLSVLQKSLRIYGENLIEERSFAGMVELLTKVAPLCSKVIEIPLQLHYERKTGASKMKIWMTIRGYIQLIFRLKRNSRSAMEWAEE